MGALQMFPLLAISFIVYAVLTFSGIGTIPGAEGAADTPWHEIVFVALPMYSEDVWEVTWGAAFLVGSMGFLFVELIRSTQTATVSIINHGLSFALFVVVLLAFILAPGFGNSTFFIFLCMSFLDPMAGFVVTTVTARRDFAVTEGLGR